ncbi:MAG: serine hydrolase [Tetrasphaera sp.]
MRCWRRRRSPRPRHRSPWRWLRSRSSTSSRRAMTSRPASSITPASSSSSPRATPTASWSCTTGASPPSGTPQSMAPSTRHLLMSVTKTVVGVIACALVEDGVLALDDRVEAIIPALAGSGFAGATVRDVLDMRTGVRFNETYHDPDADVYLMEHACGWRSPREDVPGSLREFLAQLPRDEEHGGRFRYRSSETNVLSWICEVASGQDLATLIHEWVWAQIGAEFPAHITVDPTGVAVGDGGLSATLRDVGRLADMLARNGIARSGAQVAPPWFVVDTLVAAEDSRDAFAATNSPTGMPGGHYRNQVWVPFPDRSVFLALGIHGQMVYVNQQSGVVGVKLSTWPTAQNGALFYDTLGAFESISAALDRYTHQHPVTHHQEAPGEAYPRTAQYLRESRTFFRTNEDPIYFFGPTAFNLLGLDRWVCSFTYVSYYDPWDGMSPAGHVPRSGRAPRPSPARRR